MTMPAQSAGPLAQWTEADWARALEARPDLLERLNAGDAGVLAEMIELMPGATVTAATVSTPPAG